MTEKELTPKERERKLRHALALLETAGFTEAEMKVRLEKSQVLLAELKMTVEQALGTVVNPNRDPMVKDDDFLTDRAGWVKPLLGHVARLYFCKYYSEMWPAKFIKAERLDVNSRPLLAGGHSKWFLRHVFTGRSMDVITAKAMGSYIISAMQAICIEEEKKWPREERSKFRTAFMNACMLRVCYNINQRLEETKVATVTNGETLPALNTLYEQAQRDAEKFLDEEGVKLKSRRAVTSLHHAGGARSGHAAGDRIGLDHQVGGGKGRLRLT